MSCELCNIKYEKFRVIKETEHSLSCVIIEPLIEGHVMILPKNHIKSYSEFTKEEAQDFLTLIQEMSNLLKSSFYTEAALTLINHGVNQTQEHVHFHMIPATNAGGVRDILSKFFNVPKRIKLTEEKLKEIKNKIAK